MPEQQGCRFEEKLARSIEERIELLGGEGRSYHALRDLPSYFRLFWHVSFDVEIAPCSRHYAGSLAGFPLPTWILRIVLTALMLPGLSNFSRAQSRFYEHYDRGVGLLRDGKHMEAATELRAALEEMGSDARIKRTYGMRFIRYFPHRELGVAYFESGDRAGAIQELQRSLSQAWSERAADYLRRSQIAGGPPLILPTEKALPATPATPAHVAELGAVSAHAEVGREDGTVSRDVRIASPQEPAPLPRGALTYDPTRVTQVGSRLSMSIEPFRCSGGNSGWAQLLRDEFVKQLVSLRRFDVLDGLPAGGAQPPSSAGRPEDTRLAGRPVQSDVVAVCSFDGQVTPARMSGRVVDVETGRILVAKDVLLSAPDIKAAQSATQTLAILIYNEFPLVEGTVVAEDDGVFYLDLGAENGVRPGTRCTVFREGDAILHPRANEVLGRKVTNLGELVVTRVQEKLALAKLTNGIGGIRKGDRVVVK